MKDELVDTQRKEARGGESPRLRCTVAVLAEVGRDRWSINP